MNSTTTPAYPAKQSGHTRIIFLGDVVGRPGRTALKAHLKSLKESLAADLTIVNGENAAGGAGIDSSTGHELKDAGADIVTLGDHAFQRKGSAEFLDTHSSWCIRPYNLPSDATPGVGTCRLKLASGVSVAVINLLGRVFLSGTMECPFRTMSKWLEAEKAAGTLITVCDFHAEATSEKWAMARHVDGALSLLVGTHTHVQTSDAQILPGGSAYITDLGMTGSPDGVIGMKSSVALQRFLTPRPAPYEIAEGIGRLSGVVADIDSQTGKGVGVYLI
jgi:metallophosphoesterase (TIGR00282 family)